MKVNSDQAPALQEEHLLPTATLDDAWCGLSNLWEREKQLWWSRWNWLKPALIGLVLVNGLYAMVAFIPKTAQNLQGLDPLSFELTMLMVFIILFAGASTVILMQGKIAGERQSGTAAWIMSKPVTRRAFLLSKYAVLPGMLLSLVLLPFLVAIIETSAATRQMPSVLGLIGLLSVLCSVVVFFCSLTLMLGTFFKSRTPVISIGLLTVVGTTQLVAGLLSRLIVQVFVGANLWFPLIAIVCLLGSAAIAIVVAIQHFAGEEF